MDHSLPHFLYFRLFYSFKCLLQFADDWTQTFLIINIWAKFFRKFEAKMF